MTDGRKNLSYFIPTSVKRAVQINVMVVGGRSASARASRSDTRRRSEGGDEEATYRLSDDNESGAIGKALLYNHESGDCRDRAGEKRRLSRPVDRRTCPRPGPDGLYRGNPGRSLGRTHRR